jgi:carbonic anhydrase
MIDITYRISPDNRPSRKASMSAMQAKKRLERGNTHFSDLIAGMRAGKPLSHITSISARDLGLDGRECAVQAPYAAVLACSDARVPTEMIFQQGFNDLFVVRVAGNVLGNECLGSVRYAVSHFPDTLKIVAVLGHANCGAVSAAVDAFLEPRKYLEAAGNYPLRTIVDQIIVSARTADLGLREVHGPAIIKNPAYRKALNQVTVGLNAAWNAFSLRRELIGHASADLSVVFAVYDMGSHRLGLVPSMPGTASRRGFFEPPAGVNEFQKLVVELCGAALASA